MRIGQFRTKRLFLLVAAAILVGISPSADASRTAGRIAFSLSPPSDVLDAEIWTSNPNGTERKRVARVRRSSAAEPAWSPRGSKIAFSVDHDPPGGLWVDIYVVNADGSGKRRLTGGSRTAAETSPAWSPDGKKIAFVKTVGTGFRGQGIYVMRSDGSRQHPLARNGCDQDPAWSPDGKKIVFSRCGSLYVMNADGRRSRRLTTPPPPDPQTETEFSDGAPAWSPNGTLIAFVRDEANNGRGGGDITKIFVIRPNSTGERKLTDGSDDRAPSWSPSGSTIAFASFTVICGVERNGRSRRTLIRVPGADLSDPVWRP